MLAFFLLTILILNQDLDERDYAAKKEIESLMLYQKKKKKKKKRETSGDGVSLLLLGLLSSDGKWSSSTFTWRKHFLWLDIAKIPVCMVMEKNEMIMDS